MSFCLYNKKNITRRLEDTTIFYSLAGLVRKILFCHSKIKSISSRHHVISSIYDRIQTGMTVTCSITKQLGAGRLLKSSLDLALKIKDRTGVAIP